MLDHLRRFLRLRSASGGTIADSLPGRVPPCGGPGLLPQPEPALAEAEERLGERHCRELHVWGARPPGGLGRRARAVASAASRHKAAELEEALEGLWPWEAPFLIEELESRKEVSKKDLGQTCRALFLETGSFEVLACAIGLLTPAVEEADRERLLLFGRSPALTASCAMALEPLGTDALLALAGCSVGLGRAMALERLGLSMVSDPSAPLATLERALALAGEIEDPVARAYAAVPLLEVPSLPAALEGESHLVDAIASCIEATARGGWHGGPGPGLGRLPGAMGAAEKILLSGSSSREQKERVARAVLEAHPLPMGPVLQAAQKALATE